MHSIKTYFEQLVDISDKDWLLFSSKLKRNSYKKKTTLLKLGAIENQLSFIEKGSLRLFIPKEENDVTFGFSFKNQFISAYDSFLTQTPCGYQIETLTETTLWSITHTDLQDIYKQTDIGNTIGRITAEQLFLIKSQREKSLLNETAEKRYLNLFTERPQLLKEIPLKYIASYIGVTPQALSRIRKRIS